MSLPRIPSIDRRVTSSSDSQAMEMTNAQSEQVPQCYSIAEVDQPIAGKHAAVRSDSPQSQFGVEYRILPGAVRLGVAPPLLHRVGDALPPSVEEALTLAWLLTLLRCNPDDEVIFRYGLGNLESGQVISYTHNTTSSTVPSQRDATFSSCLAALRASRQSQNVAEDIPFDGDTHFISLTGPLGDADESVQQEIEFDGFSLVRWFHLCHKSLLI